MPEQQDPSAQQTQPQAGVPVVDPQLLAAMYGMAQEDDVDLLAYWAIIKQHKKLLLATMLAVALLSAGLSLLKPNIYQATVLMAPVTSDQSSGNNGSGLASRLGGGLGGLSALAGITPGSDSGALQNLAVLKSRAFIWSFIQDHKLMPILFADAWDPAKKTWKHADPKKHPNLWDAYRMFIKGKMLSVAVDKDSGVVSVHVDWKNPVQAADWANQLVARLNDYLRKQAIARSEANLKYLNEALQKTSVADVRQAMYALIAQEQKKAMIANTQKQYAFQVLDAAAPPDKKIRPFRSLIVLSSILVTGIFMVVFVIVWEKLRNEARRRNEAGANYAP